jgi:hypothetical protein
VKHSGFTRQVNGHRSEDRGSVLRFFACLACLAGQILPMDIGQLRLLGLGLLVSPQEVFAANGGLPAD